MTGRHRSDQEAGRVDKRRAAGGPSPVDDPHPIGAEQDIQRVEIGVQQSITVEQFQVGFAVDVCSPPLPGLFSPADPGS